ncbi:MAG: hypothetical protein HY455_03025 [Parcubacteria group bacterium]|nr:hypothetical protein [Parcubacteria group bacterium]
MPFFIERPRDQHGNRGYTNSKPRVIEADRPNGRDGGTLRVLTPADFLWPTVDEHYFIEVNGPARELSEGEWATLVQARGNAQDSAAAKARLG